MRNNNTPLHKKIIELEEQLKKEKKITYALLKRVKNNLSYHANANEVFERNSILKKEVTETKKKLYYQAELSQKFSYLSRHDTLTGLVNRNEFDSRLKQAVISAQKNDETYALCFFDLDQFKVINDTAGHMAGDELLKKISSILLEHIRDVDTLARLGGDEFAILFKHIDSIKAEQKVRTILELIEDFRFPWNDNIFRLSASAGISIINNKTTTHIDSLRDADIACIAAKNAGRNRLHVFKMQDSKLTQQNHEMQWVPKINNALEKNQLKLFVQTIKPTSSSESHVHYEVLIRLQDESGEIFSPGAFLPTAERYNLITKIDRWVIENVFIWLEKNIAKVNSKTQFSINLSGQSLGDEGILKHISDLFNNTHVSPSSIQFEVTETMAISNLELANHFIKTIKDYGCGFSLDDFGSGLSSFCYLKKLDVDTLKIDGAFVRDILTDPIDAAMVDSINSIGHIMGLKTVAEFVENNEIAEKLTEMGVDYLQGYGIAKPVPIDDIL